MRPLIQRESGRLLTVPRLGAIALLAMLLGAGSVVLIVVGPTAEFALSLAALLYFVYAGAIDTSSTIISLTIFCTAVSQTFWLEHRLIVAGIPLSGPDLLIVVLGVFGLLKSWSLRCPRNSTGPIGYWLVAWAAYNSIIGIGIGLSSGNPPYAVFQEYRLVLYACVAYVVTLRIFKPKQHVRVVIVSWIGAGVMVCLWQLLISAAGAGMSTEEIFYVTEDSVGRVLRDINLPVYFAGTALLLTVMTLLYSPQTLGRGRRFAWILIPLFLSAPLLSMTRTVWVSLIVDLAALWIYFSVRALRTGRVRQILLISGLVVFGVVLVPVVIRGIMPSLYMAIQSAWDYTLSTSDRSSYARAEAIPLVLDNLMSRGAALFTGLGFGNMWSGATRIGPFNDLHNVYLAYVVIGGIPGLVLYLAVWISPLQAYRRVLKSVPEPSVKAYVLASVINWLMLSILMFAIPPHWIEAAWFGTSLAIATNLTASRRHSSFTQREALNSSPTSESAPQMHQGESHAPAW
jgi:hypothetical protein